MLIVPSLINIAWFAIIGAAAIDLDRTIGGAVSAAAQSDPAVGLLASIAMQMGWFSVAFMLENYARFVRGWGDNGAMDEALE